MPSNRLSKILGITTFGESHGPAIGVLIDSPLPGLPVPYAELEEALSRRKPSTPFETSRIEPDELEFISGVHEGKTTGTPLCIIIRNKNAQSRDYESLKDLFRPGHADFAWFSKYGIYDYRGGGRASGRETLARIVAATLHESILKDIRIEIVCTQIGDLVPDPTNSENTDNSYHWPGNVPALEQYLETMKASGDSVGGIVRVTISNVPKGLGDPVFEKLSANLAKAMLSIGSVKGIMFGDGLDLARRKGSEVNDQISLTGFLSNHLGGINGGITSGNDITFDVIVRPVSSISIPQQTIDKGGSEHTLNLSGRFDTCHIPRIIPVIEAMTKLTLCDAIQHQALIAGIPTELHQLREALDKIDEDIIDCLYRRKAIVNKVKQFKVQNNIELIDIKREQEIHQRTRKLAAESDLDPDLACEIIKKVLQICRI
ncbi:MAG TPA: chorismate synthase [Candidatus Cloacimonadota bacterium]|nr:chorismate synthase [Candidatus Cloacimonadota bacterium]